MLGRTVSIKSAVTHYIMSCRAMADLDCEEQETATATFSNGANARTGTIPVSYDAERKKMTWYYFMATSMTPAEMVRHLAPLSDLNSI